MIDFTGFKQEKGSAVYLQITAYIKRGIAAGTVKNGDELPSRRMLSALLGINPNTVQKAFSMLEDEGIIVSKAGAVSTVCIDEEKTACIKSEILKNEVLKIISAMKTAGLSLESAQKLLTEHWEDSLK